MDIPIEDLLDEQLRPSVAPQTRSEIAEADVVIAIDRGTQCQFTVFGTPALEETVRIGEEVALKTVRITFNRSGPQLDKLSTLVQAIKRGQDNFNGDE